MRREDAGGQQRELVGLAAGDDGVAGVGAAVVADDEVVLVGEEIDDLALGLVAPLQADDTGAGHECVGRYMAGLRGDGAAPACSRMEPVVGSRSTKNAQGPQAPG